jgi:hypothetical protein
MRTLLALVAASGVAGAAGSVIDNGQFGPFISPLGGAEGSHAYGQSFVAPVDARLIRFGMWLAYGDPEAPAVRVDLWGDDGEGNPDETNILIKGTVVQEIIGDLTRFDTQTNYILTPGVRYHVVLNAFDDRVSAGWYASTYDFGTDTIPDGQMSYTNDLGATWFRFPDSDFGVYVETTEIGGCYPDFTGDGVLDLFDFLAFVNAFNAGDPEANCDQEGGLDLFDFLCFTNAFNAGC